MSDRYVYIGLGFLFLISSVGLLYKRVQYNNQLLTSMRLEEQNNEAAQFGLDSNNYNIYNNNHNNKEAPQETVSKEVTQETKQEQGHEETKEEKGQATKLMGCFQDVHGERVLPKYIGMKTYEQCLQSSIDSVLSFPPLSNLHLAEHQMMIRALPTLDWKADQRRSRSVGWATVPMWASMALPSAQGTTNKAKPQAAHGQWQSMRDNNNNNNDNDINNNNSTDTHSPVHIPKIFCFLNRERRKQQRRKEKKREEKRAFEVISPIIL